MMSLLVGLLLGVGYSQALNAVKSLREPEALAQSADSEGASQTSAARRQQARYFREQLEQQHRFGNSVHRPGVEGFLNQLVQNRFLRSGTGPEAIQRAARP